MFKHLNATLAKAQANKTEAQVGTEGLGTVLIAAVAYVGAIYGIAKAAIYISNKLHRKKIDREIRTFDQLNKVIDDLLMAPKVAKAILQNPIVKPMGYKSVESEKQLIATALKRLPLFAIEVLDEEKPTVYAPMPSEQLSAGDKKKDTLAALGFRDGSIQILAKRLQPLVQSLAQDERDLQKLIDGCKKKVEDISSGLKDAEERDALNEAFDYRKDAVRTIYECIREYLKIVEGDMKYLAKTFYTDKKDG